jgi:hypothetical protein
VHKAGATGSEVTVWTSKVRVRFFAHYRGDKGRAAEFEVLGSHSTHIYGMSEPHGPTTSVLAHLHPHHPGCQPGLAFQS